MRRVESNGNIAVKAAASTAEKLMAAVEKESAETDTSAESVIVRAVDVAALTPPPRHPTPLPHAPNAASNQAKVALSLRGLFFLALFFTLYFARSLLMPATIALLLSFVLAPVVRWLKRHHITPGISAFFLVAALVGCVLYAIYSLAIPAADWLKNAPQSLVKLESKLRVFKAPVEKMREATGKVQDMAAMGSESRPEIAVRDESVVGKVLATGTEVLESLVVVVVLLYFLLAAGDMFLHKVVRVLPRIEDKIKAVELARQIESDIGHYLSTIAIINTGFGIAVGLSMYLVGLPNAALWGFMSGALVFIPYIGATVSLLVLTAVSFLTFDSLGQALLAPAVFIILDLLVENLLTPQIIGKRLALNPVIVFASLILGGWMWGIVGALAAVPILVVIKVFCDHIEQYRFIGEFISAEAS